MFHPNVATKDPPSVTATKSLLGQTPDVETLGNYIYTMQQNGLDIATHVQANNPHGSPRQIKVGGVTTTFTTIRLNRDDAGFVRATKAAVASGVKAVRDEATLGAVIDKPLDESPPAASTKTWVQSQGVTPQPQPYAPAPTPAATGRAALGDGGQVTPVVGTGTSGYNGTTDDLGDLLPGTQVQIDQPAGLAMRLDGAVLFADTGNALVRAYVPASGHVVDMGGLVANGTPQGGFHRDDHWADQTELDHPQAVTATGEARFLFVVADTRNARVRLLGPNPTPTSAAGLATRTPTPTASPSPTATATRSVSPSATATPTPGRTPTPSPTRR